MAEVFHPNIPIYLQLIESVKRKIVSGELSPGQRLPSVRDLAQTYEVNPNTAQRALAELEREGLVYSERTAGRFITNDGGLIEMTRTELAKEQIENFITEMQRLGFTNEQLLQELEQKLKKEERQDERK
ncbi:GntR family transcriptional regulator [Zongyangia hominis]|uniref:GntR family transcriptional regulator n=1 Tax=Zongyangia hominis TaxID=2763677 RepID=A0A926EBB6_9FIRM|nr:GntR family transcriptional regulator [Zongyangia hominis]MBC8570742.1 GntR family transcriptional regulator [Zongyangia hominis]